MSSKQKAVIITAAAIAGVVAISLAVATKKGLGGTPIIIKGSSVPSYVEIAGDIPPSGEKYHSADGEYTSIKVTGASGRCVVYSFRYFDGFKVYLKTDPAFDELSVDDEFGPWVGLDFDEVNRFNYDAANGKYTSKVTRTVTGLTIDAPNAKCKNALGPMPTCPTEFPNKPDWPSLENLEITIAYDERCP